MAALLSRALGISMDDEARAMVMLEACAIEVVVGIGCFPARSR